MSLAVPTLAYGIKLQANERPSQKAIWTVPKNHHYKLVSGLQMDMYTHAHIHGDMHTHTHTFTVKYEALCILLLDNSIIHVTGCYVSFI